MLFFAFEVYLCVTYSILRCLFIVLLHVRAICLCARLIIYIKNPKVEYGHLNVAFGIGEMFCLWSK